MKPFYCLLAALGLMTAAAPTSAMPLLLLEKLEFGGIHVRDSGLFALRLLNATDVIGAFSVDVHFDPGLLAFAPIGAQFGPRLGDPLLEAPGVFDASAPGVLHIEQVSLLGSTGLESLQNHALGQLLPDLLLAQFRLAGHTVGSSALTIDASSALLSDAAGLALPPPALLGLEAIHVVAEPGCTALMALCLVAQLLLRRRPVEASHGGGTTGENTRPAQRGRSAMA